MFNNGISLKKEKVQPLIFTANFCVIAREKNRKQGKFGEKIEGFEIFYGKLYGKPEKI